MLYGIKDSANLTINKLSDGKKFLYADYCNSTTNEWSSDRVYAKKKGVNAIAWDGKKESTLKLSMEIWDFKWIAMLSGSDLVKGNKDILKREVIAVAGGKLMLKEKPLTGSFSMFTLERDKVTHDKELEITASATPEAVKYIFDSADASGKTVKVNATTCPDNSFVVCYYMVNVPAKVLEIKADKYPQGFEVFADTCIRPQDGSSDEFVQIHYPNVRPKSNFTITMDSENASNLEVEFDLFPDADNNMATYTIVE